MARPTKGFTPTDTVEDALSVAFPYLIDALGIAAVALLVPTSLSLGLRFGAQLTLLVLFAIFLAMRLLPFTEKVWFEKAISSARNRILATGVVIIVLVTGTVALVTLASSAALRFQPSTQFLQLLSAVDIAWAVSTVMIGVYWLRGRTAALLAGALVGLVCIVAIARYLDDVGFTRLGRWRLDAAALWRHVLPYDIAIAVIAIGLLWAGARRRAAA